MKTLVLLGLALPLVLSGCAGVGMVATLAAPVVDVAYAEAGSQQSPVDDAFDWVCEQVGGELPRDPNTGDC